MLTDRYCCCCPASTLTLLHFTLKRAPLLLLPPGPALQAAALARQKGLPTVLVESAGSGVMEWREDTDRHLHLSAAPPSGDAISAGRLTSSPTKKGAVLG